MSSGILHRSFVSGRLADEGRANATGLARTILIVDDRESSARLLERLLTRGGHRACFAPNGTEALEAIARDHSELVLMDVLMPTLDGFETCRHFKSDPATRLIPVVLVTAPAKSFAV